MLFTVTYTNGFYSPSPLEKSGLKLVCNINIVYRNLKFKNSRLCPETSTKLYVHEFGFCSGSTDLGLWEVFCLVDFFMLFLHIVKIVGPHYLYCTGADHSKTAESHPSNPRPSCPALSKNYWRIWHENCRQMKKGEYCTVYSLTVRCSALLYKV
jgi:hypothetical protein